MKKGRSSFQYPVFLNVGGRKCTVVGGGQVALRKVNVFLEAGAEVTVVSPELCPELVELAEGRLIKVLRRDYQPGDLKEAFLAIAATDNEDINRQVMEEARSNKVLVNVVDDPDKCDFIAPSYLRRGDITIAISTDGRSPALARKIRARLEQDFGDEYASLVAVINEVRAEVRKRGVKVNSDVWQEALDLDLLSELIRKGNSEGARNLVLGKLTG